MLNVADSSGWLEYFADGPNGGFFAPAIEDTDHLLVPALCLFEVFKRIYQQRTENDALRAIAYMQQGKVVALDTDLALRSAKLSVDLKLPLADSIIFATARAHDALFWSQDSHFKGMKGVKHPQ
jgi:predicted nucleic acid-binding protein